MHNDARKNVSLIWVGMEELLVVEIGFGFIKGICFEGVVVFFVLFGLGSDLSK